MPMEQVRDEPDPLDLDSVVERAVAGDAVALEHGCVMLHAAVRETSVKPGLDSVEDAQPTPRADVVMEVR